MPKTNVAISTHLSAQPEAVFNYVSDLARHGEWSADPLKVGAVGEGPVAVGSQYRSRVRFLGRSVTGRLQVMDYHRPRRFGFTVLDSSGSHIHTFTFQAQNGGTLHGEDYSQRNVLANLSSLQALDVALQWQAGYSEELSPSGGKARHLGPLPKTAEAVGSRLLLGPVVRVRTFAQRWDGLYRTTRECPQARKLLTTFSQR